jgi:formate hydrogenlyase subunit 6/NADH:ubiquinone oxidoreductase subunit I
MNVFNVLSQNLNHGSRTRQPDDSVAYPDRYRGRLEHALTLCTGCGTCVYTCSPGAITIDDSDAQVVQWNYTEDRCTFCGFCVAYCPTQALSFAAITPAPLTERKQHYIFHSITLPPCRECGKPVRSIPTPTLVKLYGDPLPADIVDAQGLCESCRQKAIGQRFVKAMVGPRGDYDE